MPAAHIPGVLEQRTTSGCLAIALATLSACAGEKREPRFVTSTVEKGRLVGRVTATGTLSALVTVQVGSQVSGRLKEILVDFNSQVKKGQVIARIDPQLFEAALEQAKAGFIAAHAELDGAKIRATEADRQLNRSKELAEQKLIAEADLDATSAAAAAARAQVEAQKGRLELQKAALKQAEVNLGYTTISSPIDGMVVSRSVDVGQTVAASFQAPTLFVIAEDLRKMQVDTSVAEADIGRLSPGMRAEFRVDAYPTKKFEGLVRQIRNSPQMVQSVVTYDAVIDVANPELELKPGMTANVTFVYAERDDVLKVPNAALRFRPPAALLPRPDGGQGPGPRAKNGGDERTVYRLEDGAIEPVTVRIGLSDGSTTEIVDGAVKAGDVLVNEVTMPNEPGRLGSGTMRRSF
ncbi:MAG: efflux RND transporter periplasmic adaptor subunit [Deltaproteobacteria bacterium]|nr:efflux RND transporter periplasmic adaptor subunit [Deltaproteobacteria bacterium]